MNKSNIQSLKKIKGFHTNCRINKYALYLIEDDKEMAQLSVKIMYGHYMAKADQLDYQLVGQRESGINVLDLDQVG